MGTWAMSLLGYIYKTDHQTDVLYSYTHHGAVHKIVKNKKQAWCLSTAGGMYKVNTMHTIQYANYSYPMEYCSIVKNNGTL